MRYEEASGEIGMRDARMRMAEAAERDLDGRSGLQRALDDAQKQAALLNELVDHLAQRLDALLTPNPMDAMADPNARNDETAIRTQALLTERVAGHTRQLTRISSRLEGLLQRLDV